MQIRAPRSTAVRAEFARATMKERLIASASPLALMRMTHAERYKKHLDNRAFI